MPDYTTVKLKRETRNKLSKVLTHDESFDSGINRILDQKTIRTTVTDSNPQMRKLQEKLDIAIPVIQQVRIVLSKYKDSAIATQYGKLHEALYKLGYRYVLPDGTLGTSANTPVGGNDEPRD